MARKQEYIDKLTKLRDDETVLMLALSRWENPLAPSEPMYKIYPEIQPMLDFLAETGGTGSEALKLMSRIGTALDKYETGKAHGTATVGIEALKRYVEIVVDTAIKKRG